MYNVKIIPAAQKDLKKLKKIPCFNLIIKQIHALKNQPRPKGCIKLTARQGYRVRVGDYRILYEIDDVQKIIFVFRIRHRKDVY